MGSSETGAPFTEDSADNELTIAAEWHQQREKNMDDLVHSLWAGEEGQDIAEYAVMLAVILVVVVGTLRLIGSNTNTVFSNAASALQ